jgi:predicted Ser/Thr protein kinase
MSLSAGDRVGPYEILALIGAGGMGEVYQAHDTRLRRDVAIKVSAERFSERFETEARAIASLNHPNVCTLHDVGPNYLVMELVEGQTLAERIADGAIPLDEVLAIAKQIADALEAAHEKGITHRDLKPGNIKIKPDGVVKVLDFGLAKMGGTPTAKSDNSPTLTMSATQAGVILGTAAYMSPEQARGKPVDKRADIWAFGVVLYEMLTGKRLFQGEDLTDTLASVVKDAPRLDEVPASVRRLLGKCLEKDPKKRLRDIGDVWGFLEDEPASQRSAPRGIAGWIVAAMFAVAAGALAFTHFREKPPVAELVRFQIPAPEKENFGTRGFALSPDGRRLAFLVRSESGVDQLWVRALDTLLARPLAGTEGATGPFWSPDSRSIAFGVEGKLKKVDASGGPPQTLCDLPPGMGAVPVSGAWNRDGVMIFEAFPHLMRCEAGGVASVLTTADNSRGERSHTSPAFLPDGRHFVYLAGSLATLTSSIRVGSLDAKPEQQPSERLASTDSTRGFVYAPSQEPEPSSSSLGYLLLVRAGSIMAQPFNARKLALTGEAALIADDLGDHGTYSASMTGVLAYQASTYGRPLTWVDRKGNPGDAPPGIPSYVNAWNLSPDGTRMAGVVTPIGEGIRLYNFSLGNSSRFTSGSNNDQSPVWSKDGSRIIFVSFRDGVWNVVQKD